MQRGWVMHIPVDIAFRGMPVSPALEAAIHRWVARLGRVHPRILRCHVWVDQPHHRHRHGDRFQVKVVVALPGGEITCAHEPGDTNVYLAVSDAFAAARRRLQDAARIQRGDIKHHAA